MASFRLSRDAITDLDAIWLHIYEDNPEAADAVEEEIRAACALLAENPLQGSPAPRRDEAAASLLDDSQVSELRDCL